MNKTCDKCQMGEIENNRCWWCGEENTNFGKNSLDLSPICFGFLPTDESFGRTIMAMGQLFNDDRRKYKGYWIYFYSDEFEPVGTKSLTELHIHFFDDQGEIRVYLSDAKYLDISEKWGNVPNHSRTKIKKFVERYKQEIMSKIEDRLREIRERVK